MNCETSYAILSGVEESIVMLNTVLSLHLVAVARNDNLGDSILRNEHLE